MPTTTLKSLATLAVVLASAIACSSSEPNPPPPCTGTVSISGTLSVTPKISWTPACQLEGLTVVLTAPPNTVYWSVANANQGNAIAPSVTYGITPKGASVVTPATALSAGTPYTVTLYWANAANGGAVEVAGSLTFVP